MATALPIPIEFRIPDGWRPAVPDEAGAPAAAFVALIPDAGGPGGRGVDGPGGDGPGGEGSGGFTANVAIDGGFPPDSATLTSLADRSVEVIRGLAVEVTVLDRAEVGSPAAPALTQTVRLTTPVDGADRDLVAVQVYLWMADIHEPTKRAVIRLILTATAAQARAVLPDFQWFVSTVRPERPPPEPR